METTHLYLIISIETGFIIVLGWVLIRLANQYVRDIKELKLQHAKELVATELNYMERLQDVNRRLQEMTQAVAKLEHVISHSHYKP